MDGGGFIDETIVGDRDIASYFDAVSGVRVDLGIDGAQDTRQWIIEREGHDGIGGLVDGQEYEVISVSGDTFKLRSRTGIDIDIVLAPPKGTHTFKASDGSVCFSPSAPNAIDYDTGEVFITGHGFTDGQVITYDAGGNDSIGGLTDGESYKIIKVDDDTIKLKDLTDTVIILALVLPQNVHGFSKEGEMTLFTPSDGGILDYGTNTFTIADHSFSNGDIVTYSAGGEKVFTSEGSGKDTLINMEGLTGSNYDDYLIGTDTGNIIRGESGNDVLISGRGIDIMEGGYRERYHFLCQFRQRCFCKPLGYSAPDNRRIRYRHT